MLSYIYKHAPNPPSRLSFFSFSFFFCPLPTPLRLCWTAKRRRHETSDLCTRNEHGPLPFAGIDVMSVFFIFCFPFMDGSFFPSFIVQIGERAKKKKTEREQERTKKERKKKRGGNLLSETHHATRIRLFSRPRVLRYYQQECASRLERLLSGRHRPWAKLVTDATIENENEMKERERYVAVAELTSLILPLMRQTGKRLKDARFVHGHICSPIYFHVIVYVVCILTYS